MYRTICMLLVALALLVACGGDDGDDGDVIDQAATSTTGSSTSVSGEETPAEANADDEDDADSGDSSEEGPHAELSVGSSGVVESHDPGPTADFNADILSPLKVTIVDIIDPATTDSPIFQPQAGNRYWAVEVLLESTGDKTVNSGEPWIATDTDGNQYENVLITGAAADVGDDIMYGPIETGQSEQGVVVFEMPEGAEVASVSVNASIYVGGTLTFDAP